MKRRPYCVGGMSARREQKRNDSGNIWDLTFASAFPTCGRWRCWRLGRDGESRPSATCARSPRWQQNSGCQGNSGRSRRRWEGSMRQGDSLDKRAALLVRRPRSSTGWQRGSGMRRCGRTFWQHRRFGRCCGSVAEERMLSTPGQEQIPLGDKQHLLYIPAKQDLELLSQPVLKRMLGGRQRLEGLLRLLRVHGHEQEFAVVQVHQPDLQLGDADLPTGCFK